MWDKFEVEMENRRGSSYSMKRITADEETKMVIQGGRRFDMKMGRASAARDLQIRNVTTEVSIRRCRDAKACIQMMVMYFQVS